ncbi:GntR family transcriptional regulator [Atopobacter sp. AH10]|uniref:GntR family transcriptional regulator n=1 Tax=Atopobacter sp. AH10 TaxID=2315861 RepID=UPI001314298B|nr:GntR family transcriptional regulator [Atopobacter sp. AH10]
MQFDRRLPIYQQGVERIQELIASQEWPSGSTVPSRRELAQELSINPNTAQRIYRVLEDKGWIITERNVPSRVTEDEEKIKALRKELSQTALKDLVDRLKRLGNSVEDITNYLKQESQDLEKEAKESNGGGKHVNR